MATDASLSSPPSAAGLDEDLHCPECRYNLRGLTVPRCPECGYTFTWDDLPGMREQNQNRITIGNIAPVLLIVLPFAFMLLVGIPPAGLLVLVIALFFAAGAVQAGIEMLAGLWVLGTPSFRRFRAWWEGILIGYGLCAITCILLTEWSVPYGNAFVLQDPPAWVYGVLLCITAVESLLVQWWVVRRRLRSWNDPISNRRLLAACTLGKLPAFVFWTWFVLR